MVGTTANSGAERAIRWTTTVSVVVLAVIAALVSYKHMFVLVRRYGETSWTAALLPVSVDGMIVASSMSLLLDSRHGRRSGLLPWTLLVIGSAASLAANVAVAEPAAVGRLIAGWPSCALIGSYELLMRQIRHTSLRETRPASVNSYVAHTSPEAAHTDSEEPGIPRRGVMVPSYEPLTGSSFADPEKRDVDGADEVIGTTGVPGLDVVNGTGVRRSLSRLGGRVDSSIRQRAWRWAVAHRTLEGELPSGKAIASEFGRSERWGRLVKQAGLAGQLDAPGCTVVDGLAVGP